MEQETAFVTGLSTLDEITDEIEQQTSQATEMIDSTTLPRNRKERRALAKKLGKKGRKQYDNTAHSIGETAKKLDYIHLIQKLRELNEREEEQNATTKN